MKRGKVYFVGAGPGDPKLITLKGLEVIEKADAIVYDRLASPQLLKYAKADCEKIYVGKKPDRHTLHQEKINDLLVQLALQGKTVARLKGGDPSIFGRVGEEAALLVQHGIEFEIVPGVSSISAVPAYAGIPITHRDFNSSFTVVTGHEQFGKVNSTIPWAQLSASSETLIFLMGVANIRMISEQLMKHGKPGYTPVALIRWGTTARQQTLIGTLDTIAKQVEETQFKPPAVIVVGDIVKLREKLQWYERKPLFGRRVLVTRSTTQSAELANRIEQLGGEAIEFPVIHIQQPVDENRLQALDQALRTLGHYDWVLFTSVNGVEFFFRRLSELQIDIRSMHKAKIAAVGPATAKALHDRGLTVESLPEIYQAEGLIERLRPYLKPGQKVLLPRAQIGRKVLPEQLKSLGLEVVEVHPYENVPTDTGAEEIISQLRKKEIHLITFTSSSTVRNVMNMIQHHQHDPVTLLQDIDIASIGPLTTETVEQYGLTVKYQAREATIAALVEAIVQS